MTYEEYIASSQWRSLREQVLERDKHRCQTCLSAEGLQAHHKTYERLFHEDLDDLITLCAECHVAITNVMRGRKYEAKTIEASTVQRLSPVIYRGIEYGEIEVSTHIRITPDFAQRADRRPDEQIFQGDKENQRQERQDGRGF